MDVTTTPRSLADGFDAQVYAEDGFYIARRFLNDAEVDDMRDGWEAAKASLRGEPRAGCRMQRNHLYLFGDMPPVFEQLCEHPRILDAVTSVLGPNVALYMHRLLVKDAHFNAGVHLHQDYPYFNGGPKKVAVFVMLGKCDINNGSVGYVKGSHKLGIRTRDTIDIAEHPDLEIVMPTMSFGDVAFMDFLTWHYSGAGSMLDERPAMQLVFQPADDGSYNELTLPGPRLVCGAWQTDKFEPFSDYSYTKPEEPTPEDETETPTPELTPAASPQVARSFVPRLKRIVPNPVKQAIKDALERAVDVSRTIVDPHAQTITTSVRDTVEYLRNIGKTRIALAAATPPRSLPGDFVGFVHAAPAEVPIIGNWRKLPSVRPDRIDDLGEVDALIVPTDDFLPFAAAMRYLEPAMSKELPILPANLSAVVPDEVRLGDAGQALERSMFVRYLTCSALRGHFAEFGTFWGAAFLPSYHELKWILNGKFFAFDSFQGLSQPNDDESKLTNGDFREGTYACSHHGFRHLAQRSGIPDDRLVTVPGYFSDTLVGVDARRYGLEPESISVCRIDCDLLEPTAQVLEFITPLLEPGALLYFDDWRLCRASPKVGERAAALQWMEAHPEIELVEFHREGWQDQWFIYQKR